MYRLWVNDLVDRREAPTCLLQGEDLAAGCSALWRKTVTEGIDAAGQVSTVAFSLEHEQSRLSIATAPFEAAAIRRLIDWGQTPGVYFALGRALAADLREGTVLQCFEHVTAASDAVDLCNRLGAPLQPEASKPQHVFETGVALEAFVASDVAPSARFIIINGPNVAVTALQRLARTERLEAVSHLSLSGVTCDDELMGAMATMRLPSLRSLTMRTCALTDVGLMALARSKLLFGVTALVLSNQADGPRNTFGDAGVQALAQAYGLKHVESIDLGLTAVGDAGSLALVSSPYAAALREVVVWRSNVTEVGAIACARAAASRPARGLAFCKVHSDFSIDT